MTDTNNAPGNFFRPKTTFEMDGLFTQEDIDNRFYVMRQCRECKQWSQHDTRSDKRWHCQCGSDRYDYSGQRSIRTWLVTKDQKISRNSQKRSQA